MKTMMKKGVVLAAVLLVATMLVTSCMPEPGTEPGYKPPTGMGAVRLSLSLARSALPDEYTIDDFPMFSVEFLADDTYDNAGTTKPLAYYEYDDFLAPINILPGDYILTVVGYLDDEDAPVEAAAIAVREITVIAGSTLGIDIVLRPHNPITSTVTGTFEWAITQSVSDLSAATMTVTPVAGGASVLTETFDVEETTWEGEGDIVSNYYFVDFVLTSPHVATGGGVRHFRHVLHIYQNMTTKFTYVFSDDTLGAVVVVTTRTLNVDYEHPTDFAPALAAASASTGGTNALYGSGTDAAPYRLSIGNNTYPDVITITVSNATDFDGEGTGYASVQWRYHGATVPATLIAGYQLSVDTDEAPFTTQGKFMLTVTGIAPTTYEPQPGAPFSTGIYIQVGP